MTIMRFRIQRGFVCAILALGGATAVPSIAQIADGTSQRQNREQASPGITPLARINSRIQNRITSRIGARINRTGTPQTGQAEQFGDALDRSQVTSPTHR